LNLSDAMVAEFTHEAQITRRLLERLPEAKLSWKPHPKSMSMGGLSTHIAHIPHWIETIVNESELDLGAGGGERTPERKSRQEILDYFDANVERVKKTLSGKSDEQLFQTWTLKNNGEVVVSLPRAACVRSFILSHVIHHRGQLSVYLRENDVPLPRIYGPSADEGM
jgi:uncharacterized damage-inducible protein DinB